MDTATCKNCGSEHTTRNGKARGKQRYRCKECSFNFVEGDERTNETIAAKKAMLVLLYSLGKASFNMLGKLFDAWPSQVYRWVVQAGLSLPERPISGEIREMEFDEMRHFIQETCQKILESFHLRKKQALGHQGR